MLQDLIVHNPLDEDLPPDPVDRIHRLARDLAWGALNNLWSARVELRGGRIAAPRELNAGLLKAYLNRWGDGLPGPNVLVAFGYLEERQSVSPSGAKIAVGDLTIEAFKRLKLPTRTPSVYIGYHRQRSSALALLVAARLQMAGVDNPFVDLEENPGDVLHDAQHERVLKSDFFVCLLAPGSLDSDYLMTELEWANESDQTNIVPMWHGGFRPAHDYPQWLAARNAIRIEDESATTYNMALVRLLNRIGYAP